MTVTPVTVGRLICFAFICVPVFTTAVVRGREVRALKPETGVLLRGGEGRKLFKQCSRSSPEDPGAEWMPTVTDLRELERLAPKYLASRLGRPLADYCRQYVAYQRDSHRFIYVNFVLASTASAHGADWKTKAAIICDGGDGFFGLEYDADTHKFSNFLTNGVA